jgi:hypothetical protein
MLGSGYEHFGILLVNPLDGHMIMVYRKGTAYVGSIGSIYIRHSGDGGANWSNESLLMSEQNVDLRNICRRICKQWTVDCFLCKISKQFHMAINKLYNKH